MRTRSLSLPLRSSVSIGAAIFQNLRPMLLITFDDLGVQPLQDIEEVNMFKEDDSVIHFKRPLSKICAFAHY